MPRRHLLVIGLLLLGRPAPLLAAEVVITLPDHRLRAVMDTLRWTLNAPDATRMADAIVRLVSGGRYDALAQLEGTVTVRYTEPPHE